jgi:hypothetical protein
MTRPWQHGLGLAVIAVVAVLAGCTTTVSGSGVAHQPSPTATPTTPAPTTSATSSTAPPTTPAPPKAAAPPPQCPNGSCQISATIGLPNGYELLLRTGTSTTAAQSSIVELSKNGVAVAWYVADGEQPAHVSCQITDQRANCVVVNEVGAHGSDATAYLFTGTSLRRGDTVTAATPEMLPRDLNNDGTIDAAGLQNDYTPNYATGKVQWQTWTSDGLRFTSTGCGPKSTTAPPKPTAPLTGPCS